jgi:hypothetical protein
VYLKRQHVRRLTSHERGFDSVSTEALLSMLLLGPEEELGLVGWCPCASTKSRGTQSLGCVFVRARPMSMPPTTGGVLQMVRLVTTPEAATQSSGPQR